MQEVFTFLPKQRKLNAEEEKEVETMLNNRANTEKVLLQHVLQMTGKRITLRDIHHAARFNPKPGSLEEIIGELQDSPGTVSIIVV